MHPERRLEGNFDPNGHGNAWHTRKADDEEGRAIGGICKGIVEAAGFAAGAQGQEALEYMALTASGAKSFDAGAIGRERSPFGFMRHRIQPFENMQSEVRR